MAKDVGKAGQELEPSSCLHILGYTCPCILSRMPQNQDLCSVQDLLTNFPFPSSMTMLKQPASQNTRF